MEIHQPHPLSTEESVKKLTVEEQEVLSLDQKHTSFVAKIHYQKLKSRKIATIGKQLMEKLSTSFSQDLEKDFEEIPPAETKIARPQKASVMQFPKSNNRRTQEEKKFPLISVGKQETH